MYLLGLDIGSSSVKASVVKASNGQVMSLVQYPSTEMNIISNQVGWAEQEPEDWWQNTQEAIRKALQKSGINGLDISSIGISYQMHGLVLVDKEKNVIRPSIIWCDSRAVEIGNIAFQELGETHCLDNYLNSPGNFTASKLKWVQKNEPSLYNRIDKIMLPGDYINMKLTGEINTTISGLSEGVLWNFPKNELAKDLMDYFGFDHQFIPDIVQSISRQGVILESVASNLGLNPKAEITYRAGDQPNNAMSLGVINPNEVAATGGTSGVVYGILDDYKSDPQSKVNGFAHVNHSHQQKRIGTLLCINGAGIQYSWMKNEIARDNLDYYDMEQQLSSVPIGSDGLRIMPYGNGAERMLNNINPGARISNLHFNRHTRVHFYRAALEGIAFSFAYGFEILKELGLKPSVIKVGNDNLFRSTIFSETISSLLNTTIEVVDTSGAVGAAKASGIANGTYSSIEEAMTNLKVEKEVHPINNKSYKQAYQEWKLDVDQLVN